MCDDISHRNVKTTSGGNTTTLFVVLTLPEGDDVEHDRGRGALGADDIATGHGGAAVDLAAHTTTAAAARSVC